MLIGTEGPKHVKKQDLYSEFSTTFICSGPSLGILPLEQYLFKAVVEEIEN